MLPRGPPGGRSANGPKEFFMSLPWFTRMWFSAICFTTLSGTLGFISFDKFAYFGDFIFSSKLQLWRLVSCFALAGKLNFGFIMLIIMIVQYSGPLEKTFKSTAHYVWTVLLVMTAMLVINHFLFASGSLVYPLLFFCVWVYCRTPAMRNSISDVFGLFKMPTAYYPWFLLFLNVIMGSDPIFMAFGLLVGHMYHYCNNVHPATRDSWVFTPPLWFSALIPQEYAVSSQSFAEPVNRRPAPAAPPRNNVFQGQGHRVGGAAVPNPWQE